MLHIVLAGLRHTILLLTHFLRHGLQLVVHVKWHTCTNLVHHHLDDKHAPTPRLVAICIVATDTEPCHTCHDDSSTEYPTNAVVIHYTRQRHVMIYMLLAGPSFSQRDLLGCDWIAADADDPMFPLWRQGAVPFFEVPVDHLRKVEDLLRF